ncbi:tryptophan 7-halogenase [Pseudomonas aeruginosa]|nr:tryptophan 7-halogenase [Pseudomonas aeruginosa]
MSRTYDIVIIGSGIAGSISAAILAKHGLKTLILDAGQHPRFSIGEAMPPESGLLLRLLAQRFGIPELAFIASPEQIVRHIGSSACGIKLAFSFAWHAAGVDSAAEHVVAPPLDAPEAHLYRQDLDFYALLLALQHGANARHHTRIEGFEFLPEGVAIRLADGESLQARYVIDAAAQGSPLARQLGVRTTDGLATHTCSFFTHMLNVKAYEEVASNTDQSPIPLFQSTLHHIFEEGWLWIIPFDNHSESTNRLCSVGFQYNCLKYQPSGTPEQEFSRLLDRYPSIARHFTEARVARDWVHAPRLNYRSRTILGERFCLLAQAAGFIDPLFSRGLITTFESILRLMPRLIDAVRQDHWQLDRFASVERHLRNAVAVNDRLGSCSYEAFRDFPLWNAWPRVWLSGSNLGGAYLGGLLQALRDGQAGSAFDAHLESARCPGHLSFDAPGYEDFFESACRVMDGVRQKRLSSADAISTLHRLLGQHAADLLPYDYANLDNRFLRKCRVQ